MEPRVRGLGKLYDSDLNSGEQSKTGVVEEMSSRFWKCRGSHQGESLCLQDCLDRAMLGAIRCATLDLLSYAIRLLKVGTYLNPWLILCILR